MMSTQETTKTEIANPKKAKASKKPAKATLNQGGAHDVRLDRTRRAD